MKKFTLLVLSILTATCAMADRISTKQAQQNVMTFVAQEHPVYGRSVQKPYDKVYESEGYFVFAGKANKGFVIAAADDQMTAPVLGYTDSGNFDANNMPENMKAFLANYDNEAKWLAANPEAKMKTTRTSRAAITPLLTTHWAQDPFYNDQCPMVGKVRCATGCVATAAAQVMYFHKWPETGRGTNTYMWGKQQLTRDFSQSTYDWNSMTTRIDSTSTQKSKAAVAKLMSDVGIAVCMSYDEESAAIDDSIPYALPTFFKYSREAYVAHRTYYTTEEWEQLAYESLQRREPICYAGEGSSGHEFVCDGYKDGYFHFNWGWDNGKDGYFLLSALNPKGVVPAGGYNPYSGGQSMVLNMRPDKADTTKVVPHFVSDYDFFMYRDSITGGYTTTTYFYTRQYNCTKVLFGLEFVDSTGKSEFRYLNESKQYKYKERAEHIIFPKSLFPTKDGKYTVYPVVYGVDSKTHTRILTKSFKMGYTTFTVKNGKIDTDISDSPEKYLAYKNLTYGKFYADKSSQVKVTFVNKTKRHYGDDVIFFIKDKSTKEEITSTTSFVDLEPGDSINVLISLKAPSDLKKSYIFVIEDNGKDQIMTTDIQVNAIPAGKFAAKLTSEPKVTIDEDFNVTVVADYVCTSGFCDNIDLTFFDVKTGKNASQYNMQLPMGAGDTGTMTFNTKFDTLKSGTEYNFNICGYVTDYITLAYGSKDSFTVKTPGTTDIETIEEVVNDNNNDNTIYDLQGRKVLNPRHGQIYIINGKKVLK